VARLIEAREAFFEPAAENQRPFQLTITIDEAALVREADVRYRPRTPSRNGE
jgi:hypothetical protein